MLVWSGRSPGWARMEADSSGVESAGGWPSCRCSTTASWCSARAISRASPRARTSPSSSCAPRAARSSAAKRDDPMLDVLSRRGTEHETAHLERLRADHELTIVEIDYPDSTRVALADAQEQTLEAMRKGVDVIYQATFFDGRWRGHADFLFRVDGDGNGSDLGDWSYEVADAKLARRVKAAAILQMCAYSDQLAAPAGPRAAPHPRHHRRRRAAHREALRLLRLLPRAEGALRGARPRRARHQHA